MHGNLNEWCQDQVLENFNQLEPFAAWCGGNFSSNYQDVGGDRRYKLYRYAAYPYLGFRPVRTILNTGPAEPTDAGK
jgi:formylglycine-generating enzyme required for sulfatase activity